MTRSGGHLGLPPATTCHWKRKIPSLTPSLSRGSRRVLDPPLVDPYDRSHEGGGGRGNTNMTTGTFLLVPFNPTTRTGKT